MEEMIKNSIMEVDQLIETKDFSKALSVLSNLSEQYPDEGIIPYYLGRVCLNVNEEDLALHYFLVSIKKNFINSDLFLMTGILLSDEGEEMAAEECLIKAEITSTTDEDKWIALSALAIMYLDYERFLKSERIIKQLIREYPNNYQGYHLYLVKKVLTEQYDEANAFLSHVPLAFQNHPQYLLDYMELLRIQNKEDELLMLIETDSRFKKIVPYEVLRERLNRISENDSLNQKKEIILELAKEYHDCDAIVSLMIITFAESDYKKSSQIATLILDKEKDNQGIRFYLALYFQIFNLYFISEKNPSESLANWIQAAGNWCVEYADSFNSEEIGDRVRNSIEELFNEINQTNYSLE